MPGVRRPREERVEEEGRRGRGDRRPGQQLQGARAALGGEQAASSTMAAPAAKTEDLRKLMDDRELGIKRMREALAALEVQEQAKEAVPSGSSGTEANHARREGGGTDGSARAAAAATPPRKEEKF